MSNVRWRQQARDRHNNGAKELETRKHALRFIERFDYNFQAALNVAKRKAEDPDPLIGERYKRIAAIIRIEAKASGKEVN